MDVRARPRSVRESLRRCAHLSWVLVIASAFLAVSPLVFAQDSPKRSTAEPLKEREGQTSVTKELADTIAVLEKELHQAHESLKTAQTDRERQLIHAHIEFLKKEQELLQQLLNTLSGTKSNIQEAAREQEQALRDERMQRRLEQDKRFPPAR